MTMHTRDMCKTQIYRKNCIEHVRWTRSCKSKKETSSNVERLACAFDKIIAI